MTIRAQSRLCHSLYDCQTERIVSEMPKIKQTARKEAERPEPAVKELCCLHCGHAFNKGYNYRRHLAIMHGVDEHGQPTSADDRARYQELAVDRNYWFCHSSLIG